MVLLRSAVQEQCSPRPAALAPALETGGETTLSHRLRLMSGQRYRSISCHTWGGYESRRDSHVQRSREAESSCYSCHLLLVWLLVPIPFLPGLLHYQWTLLPETTSVLPRRGTEASGGDQTSLWTGGQSEEHRGATGAGAALRQPAGVRQAQVSSQKQQG